MDSVTAGMFYALVVGFVGTLLFHIVRLVWRVSDLRDKVALHESRVTAADEKMAAVLEILRSDSQHLTTGDLHELQRQGRQEEARFDANLADAVGVLGLGAVKAGPMKACCTRDHGGQC